VNHRGIPKGGRVHGGPTPRPLADDGQWVNTPGGGPEAASPLRCLDPRTRHEGPWSPRGHGGGRRGPRATESHGASRNDIIRRRQRTAQRGRHPNGPRPRRPRLRRQATRPGAPPRRLGRRPQAAIAPGRGERQFPSNAAMGPNAHAFPPRQTAPESPTRLRSSSSRSGRRRRAPS
jgi:hypothetical protein